MKRKKREKKNRNEKREKGRKRCTSNYPQRLDSGVGEVIAVGGNGLAAHFVRPSSAVSNHVDGMLQVHHVGKLGT